MEGSRVKTLDILPLLFRGWNTVVIFLFTLPCTVHRSYHGPCVVQGLFTIDTTNDYFPTAPPDTQSPLEFIINFSD